jgi:hypothetical protein
MPTTFKSSRTEGADMGNSEDEDGGNAAVVLGAITFDVAAPKPALGART